MVFEIDCSLHSGVLNVHQLSSTEAVELLCSRKLTAVQYATALLERATKTFVCINAFAFLDAEKVPSPGLIEAGIMHGQCNAHKRTPLTLTLSRSWRMRGLWMMLRQLARM